MHGGLSEGDYSNMLLKNQVMDKEKQISLGHFIMTKSKAFDLVFMP